MLITNVVNVILRHFKYSSEIMFILLFTVILSEAKNLLMVTGLPPRPV